MKILVHCSQLFSRENCINRFHQLLKIQAFTRIKNKAFPNWEKGADFGFAIHDEHHLPFLPQTPRHCVRLHTKASFWKSQIACGYTTHWAKQGVVGHVERIVMSSLATWLSILETDFSDGTSHNSKRVLNGAAYSPFRCGTGFIIQANSPGALEPCFSREIFAADCKRTHQCHHTYPGMSMNSYSANWRALKPMGKCLPAAKPALSFSILYLKRLVDG